MVRNMHSDFKRFAESLDEAGKRMDKHYFQLDVARGESKYRERVYCYELYHQLRCTLGNDYPYKLDGEVDKNGHPIIHPALGAKKPDLIVHVPRRMDRNLVVIEIKPVTVGMTGLRTDLEKLKGFLDVANYYRAIMLIYGNGENGELDLPKEILDEVENFSEDRLLLAWHHGPGEKLRVIGK